jgi:uncharacterized cupredoxin-like copper-binding protein
MNPKILTAAALAGCIATFAATAHDQDKHPYGEPGDAQQVKRTITVTMGDTMRFNPARITVKRGETIRFVVKNAGELKHEMTLGTIQELKEHAALMQKFPEMEHEEPNMVTVEPGKIGEMIWKFTNAGTVDFACLVPGHYESGMKGQIVVNR